MNLQKLDWSEIWQSDEQWKGCNRRAVDINGNINCNNLFETNITKLNDPEDNVNFENLQCQEYIDTNTKLKYCYSNRRNINTDGDTKWMPYGFGGPKPLGATYNPPKKCSDSNVNCPSCITFDEIYPADSFDDYSCSGILDSSISYNDCMNCKNNKILYYSGGIPVWEGQMDDICPKDKVLCGGPSQNCTQYIKELIYKAKNDRNLKINYENLKAFIQTNDFGNEGYCTMKGHSNFDMSRLNSILIENNLLCDDTYSDMDITSNKCDEQIEGNKCVSYPINSDNYPGEKDISTKCECPTNSCISYTPDKNTKESCIVKNSTDFCNTGQNVAPHAEKGKYCCNTGNNHNQCVYKPFGGIQPGRGKLVCEKVPNI